MSLVPSKSLYDENRKKSWGTFLDDKTTKKVSGQMQCMRILTVSWFEKYIVIKDIEETIEIWI